MFDIGWTEMMVIAVVAIVVVGPKELPGMLRTFGKTMGKVRRMSRDFQRQFDEALKEADLDEVRKGIETVKKANPTHALRQAMSPVSDEMAEVDRVGKASPAASASAAARGPADRPAVVPAGAMGPVEPAPSTPETSPADDAEHKSPTPASAGPAG